MLALRCLPQLERRALYALTLGLREHTYGGNVGCLMLFKVRPLLTKLDSHFSYKFMPKYVALH